MSRTTETSTRDRGASLILAIGFVLLIGLIVGALTTLIASSANNRVSLINLRDRQYAAEAGIEEAIVSIRTALDAAAAPQVYEIPTCGWSSNLNGVDVRVDCTRAVNAIASTDGDVIAQHNVVFVACLDTGSACDTDTPVIRAQVNFEKKFTDAVTKTYIQSWSVFG